MRLSRGSSELSLICAELVERRKLAGQLGAPAFARLENALVSAIRTGMNTCDSLGQIADGRHALLLPGIGFSGARLLGEKLQKVFAEKTQYLHKDLKITCALGIVCIGQDEADNATDMLSRGSRALQKALAQGDVHICQERQTLSERPTLVHPDEKRFLFFGEA